MYILLRTLLFLFNPELAHSLTMGMVKWFCKIPGGKFLLLKLFRPHEKPVMLDGIHFPNRVGLAAGFDKNGKYIDEWYYLGFGHVEVGTVTPLPQDGNPKPRLFRLPQDHALINRMGFNNDGVEALVDNIRRKNTRIIVGGNIGKNKATPNENALQDYLTCFNALFPFVDYFTVNVSSPNTPGLRELQDKRPLTELMYAIMNLNRQQEKPKPVYLKIAPDLSETQIVEIGEIVTLTGANGVIATNTTIDRSNLLSRRELVEKIGAGGLSGRPLNSKSTEVIRLLRRTLGPSKTIIGIGGIETAQDAMNKIEAGANLVQVYTGYIYRGPGLVKEIVNTQRN